MLILIRDLTLRAVASGFTAFLGVLLLSPCFIRQLHRLNAVQIVRELGPKQHYVKSGTPTLGGVLVLAAIVLATLLWGDLSNRYLWLMLLVLLGFGAIGLLDDYRKVVLRHNRGLAARWKYLLQSLFALGIVSTLFVWADTPAHTALFLPFFKTVTLPMGVFYLVMGYFVIVGSSNAVNLTDGLDGLAIFPVAVIAMALGGIAYLVGHEGLASAFALPYLHNTSELLVFCSAMFGASLGFLWFNGPPAEVFMGDVGALGLGAALGLLAILLRQELLLLLMGGLFVAETLSVILQVACFKLTGKRIFRMAPLHHHFELKGWPESRVVTRFWIVTIVLVILGVLAIIL